MRFHNRLNYHDPLAIMRSGNFVWQGWWGSVIFYSVTKKALIHNGAYAFTDTQEQINDSPENLWTNGYWINFLRPQGCSKWNKQWNREPRQRADRIVGNSNSQPPMERLNSSHRFTASSGWKLLNSWCNKWAWKSHVWPGSGKGQTRPHVTSQLVNNDFNQKEITVWRKQK